MSLARILLVGFVSVLLLFTACSKENTIVGGNNFPDQVYDTVYPLQFYPAFPGTYWLYKVISKSDTDTAFVTNYVSVTAEPEYVLHAYIKNKANFSDPSIKVESDSVYVPMVYTGSDLVGTAIYGYQYLQDIPIENDNRQVLWPFLKDKVGQTFNPEYRDNRLYDYNEYITVVEKVDKGAGDTLMTLTGRWKEGEHKTHRSFRKYFSNIGLTEHLVLDTITNDTVLFSTLVTYKIGQ